MNDHEDPQHKSPFRPPQQSNIIPPARLGGSSAAARWTRRLVMSVCSISIGMGLAMAMSSNDLWSIYAGLGMIFSGAIIFFGLADYGSLRRK